MNQIFVAPKRPHFILNYSAFQWPPRVHVLSFASCQYFRYDVLPVVGNHSNYKGILGYRRAGVASTEMTTGQVYMAAGGHYCLQFHRPEFFYRSEKDDFYRSYINGHDGHFGHVTRTIRTNCFNLFALT